MKAMQVRDEIAGEMTEMEDFQTREVKGEVTQERGSRSEILGSLRRRCEMSGVQKLIVGLAILATGSSFVLAEDWPMYGRDLRNTHFSPGTGNMYNEPSVSWSSSGSYRGFGAAIVDIDRDSMPEVIVSDSWGKMQVFNHDGSLLWTFVSGFQVFSAPAVADLDKNGFKEIVYGCTKSKAGAPKDISGKVYALNYDGTIKWSYTSPSDCRFLASAAAANLNWYAKLEVVIGGDDGCMYALNHDGTLLWSYLTGGEICSSPS
jgi:hypothetical protein